MSEQFYKALEEVIYENYCKWRESAKSPEIEEFKGYGLGSEIEEKIARAVSKACVKVHMDRLDILEKKVSALNEKFVIKCPEPGKIGNAI